MKNKIVTLVTVEGCHLCDSARNAINAVRKYAAMDCREIVIDQQHTWYERYGDKVPVVLLNDKEIAYWRVSVSQLLDALES